MKSDLEVSYDAALQKRQQLEREIHKSAATNAQKSDMLHSLSKLWLFVGDLRDTAVRSATRTSGNPTEGP